MSLSPALGPCGLSPVSYTHLDVYKRQGTERVTPFADEFAFIDHDVNIDALGGTVKTAEHMGNIPTTNPQKVFDFISRKLPEYLKELPEGKVKLGISFYKFDIATGKINASMLSVKKVVRASGRSVRIVPNLSLIHI